MSKTRSKKNSIKDKKTSDHMPNNQLHQKNNFQILCCCAVAVCVIGYFLNFTLIGLTSDSSFGSSRAVLSKCHKVPCSKDYKNFPIFSGCTPSKSCGRCVKDGLVNATVLKLLQDLIENGLSYGGSSGGASILDLHSGALSHGQKFVNIYKYLSKEQLLKAFPQKNIDAYIDLKNKIHSSIAKEFDIEPSQLYLTKPTFFSRMTSAPAKTQHDEYWHSHIDKIQYGSFDYTALLYLATYKDDFDGGRFIFDSSSSDDAIIEPKRGRISFFTSGSENPHHVEKVISGIRFALTVSFTCDPSQAIKDPSFKQ